MDERRPPHRPRSAAPSVRTALRRVIVLCSSMTGAGTTATALNVAARLTSHGDVLLVDCDLSGSGVTAIAGARQATLPEHGLGDVIQHGVYLAPAALLAQAGRIGTAGCEAGARGTRVGELRLVPGRGGGATTLADDLVTAGIGGNVELGASLVDAPEASRRLDELLALLIDWSSSGYRERWVVLDVPPHPFIATLILSAVHRLSAATEIPHHRAALPFLLMCFASSAEHAVQAERLRQLIGVERTDFEMLCTRGGLDGLDMSASFLRAAPKPRARAAPPIIPFDQILFGGAQLVGAGMTAGTPAASSYDALVEWLRREDG